MDNQFPITVILPTYNTSQYVVKCLRSLKFQNVPYELIVIDDGSTDGTQDLTKSILDSEDWPSNIVIKQINLPENKGVAYARNVAVNEAKGEYLFFMDSDDLLEKDSLRKLLKKAEEFHAEIVFAHAITSSGDTWRTKLATDKITEGNEILNAYLDARWVGAPWNKLISKKFLMDNKIDFITDIQLDDEIWNFRIAVAQPKAICLDEYTYFYDNLRGDSIVNTYTKTSTRSRGKWLAVLISEFIKIALNAKCADNDMFLNALRYKIIETFVQIPKELSCGEKELFDYYKELSDNLSAPKVPFPKLHLRVRRALKLSRLPQFLRGRVFYYYMKHWLSLNDPYLKWTKQ